MSILSRYIVKEHVGPFFFSLAVIMFVFVTKFIAQYIGKLFGKGLPFSTIFEVIYLNLAWMLALAVPMAVLIAALSAFGRLSADNEITIFKTCGINLYRVIAPVLVVAIAVMGVMVWYNDKVLPEFNHRARLLFHTIRQKKPTLELEAGLYTNLENKYNILVERVERAGEKSPHPVALAAGLQEAPPQADRLFNITIFDYSDPQMQRIVVARYGYLILNKQLERLEFTLFDGEIHELDVRNYSEYRRAQFGKNVFYIPAKDMVFKRPEETDVEETLPRGDREMTIRMMKDKVEEARNSIAEEHRRLKEEIGKLLVSPEVVRQRLAAKEALPPDSLLPSAGRNVAPDSLTARIVADRIAIARASRQVQGMTQKIRTARNNLKFFRQQIYKYEVEIHKKYSIPFACIVFVLVGAPLGIRTRKGSKGIAAALSILFFLLYWACLIGGEELADRQIVMPWLAMWFPNILVGTLGIYLTISTVRETTFFQWERLPQFLRVLLKTEEE
ncbi:MAG: YjgP/YjgQ family permease, partial [Calditrichaeota bacterium]